MNERIALDEERLAVVIYELTEEKRSCDESIVTRSTLFNLFSASNSQRYLICSAFIDNLFDPDLLNDFLLDKFSLKISMAF